METPDVTPTQYGAGGLFAGVVAGCLAKDVGGTDLLAYLGSGALVTGCLVLADMGIRRGRGANAAQLRVVDKLDADGV